MLRRIFPLSMLCLLMISALAVAQDQPNNGGAAAPGAGAGAGAGNQAGGGAGGGGGGGGGGGFGGGGGGGGNRRNFDPAQFRQRMMDNIKDQLNVTDDEWQVLQPKIEKVMTSQRDLRAGMGMFRRQGGGGGAGGGGGGGFGATDDSPVAKATQDLRDTLDNKDSTADTITQKLTALRDARTKAQTDLAAAQKDLKDVLTQRQEASLVMMGMLE
jgi:hypothetical protein